MADDPQPELQFERAPCPRCGAVDMEDASGKCRPQQNQTGEYDCPGEFANDGYSVRPTAASLAALDAWIDREAKRASWERGAPLVHRPSSTTRKPEPVADGFRRRKEMLTEEQARAVAEILNEECDARMDERDVRSFAHYVTDAKHPCKEWRFCGALGFGGKLRVNGNKPHPYVDCYREHETPERLQMIERANARLESIVI